MPTWLRHKTRGFPSGDFLEEMWDSGGRRMSHGKYVGGDYFRANSAGTRRSKFVGTFGVPGTPIWTYPNWDIYATDPDRYSFDYTWRPDSEKINPWVDFEDVNQFGATAWNRMRPDRPDMSILNAVYETRDIPRSLKPRILEHRDTAAWADFHLAVQFGWLPTLRDVQDFTKSTLLLKKRLDQLVRDNGKLVHRSMRFKGNDGNSSSSHKEIHNGESYSAFADGMVTQVHANVPRFEDVCEAGINTWATGNFRYYLSDINQKDDWRWKTSMYARILGGNPSPATVWNAIPWSWLTDWFSNIGDVLENIDYTVADRLFAESAFLMQRRFDSYRRTSYGDYYTPDGSIISVSASTSFTRDSKVRTIIDPFGPSATSGGLSGLQASILGAIGLSRLPSAGGGYNGFDPSSRAPILKPR